MPTDSIQTTFYDRLKRRTALANGASDEDAKALDKASVRELKDYLEDRFPDGIASHALDVAVQAHGEQKRKGSSIPYYYHLIEVAILLATRGCDEQTVAAGIMHDVLEDVDAEIYSKTDMKRDFGPNVTELVEWLSEQKTESVDGEVKEIGWRERKEAYIAHLKDAPVEALNVCLADKISNLHSMIEDHRLDADHFWQKFHNTNPLDHLWYYESVGAEIARNANINQELLKRLRELMVQAKAELFIVGGRGNHGS